MKEYIQRNVLLLLPQHQILGGALIVRTLTTVALVLFKPELGLLLFGISQLVSAIALVVGYYGMIVYSSSLTRQSLHCYIAYSPSHSILGYTSSILRP